MAIRIAAIVMLLAAPLLAQFERYFFDDARALPLDASRLAVLSATGKAPPAATWGFRPDDVTAWPIDGWYVVTLPAELRNETAVRKAVARLAGDDALAFVTPVFLGDGGGPVFVTPDLLVQLRPGLSADRAAAVLAEHRAGRILEREWGGLPGAYRIASGSRSGIEVLARANELARRPETRLAEPDFIATGKKCFFPNDALLVDQWAVHYGLQQGISTADADMDVQEAWDISMGDPSVLVAILDDGIVMSHPDLHTDVIGTDTTSQAPSDGSPLERYDDHGTVVAGVIAGTANNGHGMAGVVPDASYASIRIFVSTAFDAFTVMSSWTVAGLAAAESLGAQVTNSSFNLDLLAAATAAKYDQTRMNGIIHFASGGNDPLGGTKWPAKLASVHGVVSINVLGQISPYSSAGPDMSFAAPGESIVSTDRPPPLGFDVGDSYITFHGTTFASAYGTSCAALALSVNPALTSTDLDGLLALSAIDYGPAGFDPLFAGGYLNAYAVAWHAALSLPDPAERLFLQPAPAPDTGWGDAMAGLGDLDGDGVSELAVAAPLADDAGPDSGRVTILSGRDGSPLHVIDGAAGDEWGRTIACLGDVDGDGVDDFAVGSPVAGVPGLAGAGRVAIHSGATFAVIRTHAGTAAGERLGRAVAGIGDADGDGRDDYVLGVPGAAVAATPDVGRVDVVSGATGSLLRCIEGDPAAGDGELGFALARAGDIDGDGVSEIIAGAPASDVTAGMDAGRVHVRDGATGMRIHGFDGAGPAGRFGESVASWGDIDGDGVPDAACGAPAADLGNGPDQGYIVAHSGANGMLLTGYLGEAPGDRFGEALAPSPDIDDDGLLDLVVTAPGHDEPATDAGKIYVYSQHFHRARYQLTGFRPGQRLGRSATALGDVDGDGLGEIAVGAPGDSASTTDGFSVILPAPHPGRVSKLPTAAAGNLDSTTGGPYDVLQVNDSSGGLDRVVEAPVGAPLKLDLIDPETHTGAAFTLFVFGGIPQDADVTPLPGGIGDLAFPPCSGVSAAPSAALFGNLPICPSTLPVTPTPWTLRLDPGFMTPSTLTFQAIIEEQPGRLRVTNAVVLEVE